MKLPQYAIATIETWRLGFVGTATADGKPNVSPKGTFLVLDDQTIAFGEMRSPNTVANLRENPRTEVNFVDILSRKGVRIRGDAVLVEKNSAEYADLLPRFQAIWGDLCDQFNVIVKIPADEVKPLQSPIYEFGGEEAALRAQWKDKIANMQG